MKIDKIDKIKTGRLICSDVNSSLVTPYVKRGVNLVIYQSMAVRKFLKGDNRHIFDELPKEAKKYYNKVFDKDRRTSWDDLLKKDSKQVPVIFVNTAESVKWGGDKELGGGNSGIYYRGKCIYRLGEKEGILRVDIRFGKNKKVKIKKF